MSSASTKVADAEVLAPAPLNKIDADHFKRNEKRAPGALDVVTLVPLPILLTATSLLSATWIGFPIAFLVYSVYYVVKNWKKREVIKQRYTAVQNGSFVVFHIGANWNGRNKLNKAWKETGEAMRGMLDELERLPAEESGFLGAQQYIAVKDGHRMAVQYWKSMGHLQAYARGTLHTPAWAKFKKITAENPDLCIFHESFEVEDGAYETIYVNCDPILLGNTYGSSLYPCEGRYKSAAGRTSKILSSSKVEVEVKRPVKSASKSVATGETALI